MRPIALLVLVLGLLLETVAPPASADLPDGPDVRAALSVLHGWDDRRAVAWARSDERELRSLYAPGSAAARADVRLLRSWTGRGLVVRRLVTQVFGVRVLRQTPGRITLRVLDRVAGGVVTDGSRSWALDSTRPVVRRVDLVMVGGDWRVAAVTGWG